MDRKRKDLEKFIHPFHRLLSILHHVTRARAKEARLSDNINRQGRTEGEREETWKEEQDKRGKSNEKGSNSEQKRRNDGWTQKWKNREWEMQQRGKETMKGWAQGRERERNRARSTSVPLFIIFPVQSRTHTHTEPTRAPPRRGNLSHVCERER